MATIEELMKARFDLTKQIRDLEADLKTLKGERDGIDEQIIETLSEQGVDSTRIKGLGSVSISQNEVPTVKNWDEFYNYIKEQDALYLLQRRVSSKPIAELFADGEKVPGIEFFTQIKLNARAA